MSGAYLRALQLRATPFLRIVGPVGMHLGARFVLVLFLIAMAKGLKSSREQRSAERASQRAARATRLGGQDHEERAPASAPASAGPHALWPPPASGSAPPIAAAPRVLFGPADEDAEMRVGPDDLRHSLFSGECGLPILTLPAFYDCSPIHPFLLSAIREHGWQPRACRPAWWTSLATFSLQTGLGL